MYDRLLGLKYLGIFILMLLFPSESIMPLAGHMAATAGSSLVGMILAGVLGSTIGSVVIYAVARLVGQERAHHFVAHYGKFCGVSARSVERAGRWFDRHATATVFFGRFVPGVRTAVAVPAGVRSMPLMRFAIYTTAGNAVWLTFLAMLGYYARAEYVYIRTFLVSASNFIVIGLVGVAVLYVAQRMIRRRRTRR